MSGFGITSQSAYKPKTETICHKPQTVYPKTSNPKSLNIQALLSSLAPYSSVSGCCVLQFCRASQMVVYRIYMSFIFIVDEFFCYSSLFVIGDYGDFYGFV